MRDIHTTRLLTALLGALPLAATALLATGTVSSTLPYATEGMGPTYNTLGQVNGKEVVHITGTETYPTSGNLNMTTVAARRALSFRELLNSWLISDETIVPEETLYPRNLSHEQVTQRYSAAFTRSETAATYAALTYLGRSFNAVISDLGSATDTGLATGDTLLSIDGTTGPPQQLIEAIRAHTPGDTITVGIRRGDQELTLPVTARASQDEQNPATTLGVTVTLTPADGTHVEYNLEDIGGASAGLMFTLAVIDKLTPQELTGGRFVAGTGTMNAAGQVGPIGGIIHKIEAAAKAGATVFLVPEANCAEAMTSHHEGVALVKVTTITDAVQALESINSGQDVPKCS